MREFTNLKNPSQRFFVGVDNFPGDPFGPSRALSSAFRRDRAEFFTTEDTESTEKKIREEVLAPVASASDLSESKRFSTSSPLRASSLTSVSAVVRSSL
jgi:hypothetical protein